MLSSYTGILIFLILCVGFAGVVLLLSYLVGHRTVTREKLMPYECGMDPVGDARIRFSVKFYLVAMLFIVFDLESVFLYPWAVIYKELGTFGFVEMLIFIAILLIGFIYVWGKGALEWE